MSTDLDEYELELEAADDERPGPSRPLRFLPRGRWLVEVTTRTTQGRYLMRPSARANAAIEGVLGHALHEHPDVHLVGYWFLSNHYIARKNGKPTRRSDFETRHPIVLHPLPCWEEVAAEERQMRCLELVQEIEETARREREREGRRVIGRKAILEQDPHHRPDHVAKSAAPLVHASSRADRSWFFDRYYGFLRRYRRAAARFLGGAADAIDAFPRGAFLPRPPVGLRIAG